MTGLANRHNLSDWLILHDLDPSLCSRLLSAAAGKVGGEVADQNKLTSEVCAVDPDAAWLGAVEAISGFFPMERSAIERTSRNISKILVKDSKNQRRAITLNDGGNGYPLILYTYRGTASDCMVIAHEFSHALQIVASKGMFVTPIIREVCAFVGEIALMSRVQATEDNRYFGLRQVWHRDNCKYLAVDRADLESVLRRPESSYRYNWNYPIARYLSIEISEKLARERIWAVFEGKVSMRQLVGQFGY